MNNLFFRRSNYLIVCGCTQLPSKVSVQKKQTYRFYKFKFLIGVIFITMYIQSIGSGIYYIDLYSTTPSAMPLVECNPLDEDFFISTIFLACRNSYHLFRNKYNNIFNKIIIFLIKLLKYIIIYTIIINILLQLTYFISLYYPHTPNLGVLDLFLNFIPDGKSNDTLPMDPVRWWPSGVPQGWSVVGTALATFAALSKLPNVSPRLRVLGALGSAGVTATQITYHSAVENSVGFNRLMWGITEYRKNGVWPSIDQVANKTNDTQINDFASEAIKHANQETVNSIVNEVKPNGFVPSSNFDLSEIINKLIDLIFKETMQILQPAHVQGFLDDLIGQRMFIEAVLLIMCISTILLFIVFIFNIIFLLNKDKIIKKFDNKFITFYIKYQAFFSRLSLIYIPILIFTGLLSLCHGLHWLTTHQIPYESLDIDLHQFISSPHSHSGSCSPDHNKSNLQNVIGLILISNNIRISKTQFFTNKFIKTHFTLFSLNNNNITFNKKYACEAQSFHFSSHSHCAHCGVSSFDASCKNNLKLNNVMQMSMTSPKINKENEILIK
jgi:hypothetical protein